MSEKFKIREEVSIKPDTMGNSYKFFKISMDDFVSWFEIRDKNLQVSPNKSLVEEFLDTIEPEYNWYVVPDRIYFSKKYSEDNWSITEEDTPEIPAGSTIFVGEHSELFFTETQKWVKALDSVLCNLAAAVDYDTARSIIKKTIGK